MGGRGWEFYALNSLLGEVLLDIFDCGQWASVCGNALIIAKNGRSDEGDELKESRAESRGMFI